MTKAEINSEVAISAPCDTHLMGTKAYHQLSEISRDKPGIFHAAHETDDYWIGSWVEGFGFFDVRFPKDTSRALTKEEVAHYEGRHYAINSQPSRSLRLTGSTTNPMTELPTFASAWDGIPAGMSEEDACKLYYNAGQASAQPAIAAQVEEIEGKRDEMIDYSRRLEVEIERLRRDLARESSLDKTSPL